MRGFSRILLLACLALALQIACTIAATPAPTSTAPAPTNTQPPATLTPTPAPIPPGQIAYSSDRGESAQIIVMDLQSGMEHNLTAAYGSYYRPVWSPNGDRLAVRMDITMEGGAGIAVLDVGYLDGQLIGSEPLPLVRAFTDSPTWSADGSRVAYIDGEGPGGWRAFSIDTAGNSPQALPGIPANATDLDWSPDGTQLVFSYYENSPHQIGDLYVAGADGSGLTNLTKTPDIYEGGPRWSPDGKQIVFSAREYNDNGNGSADIYRMNSDGSGIARVTVDTADEFDPSWSPDGRQIAFTSDRFDFNDGNYEIYVINADGTGEKRLTNNRFTDRWPVWRKTPADYQAADCRSGAQFAADVTIPAGTRFALTQDFSKAWRIVNGGSCAWPAGAYTLRFAEGEQLEGADQVATDGAVQPGDSNDLAVSLTAPGTPGIHQGKWILYDGGGQPVPDPDGNPLTLTVSIEVLESGETVLPAPLYYLTKEGGNSRLWRMETNAATAYPIAVDAGPIDAYAVSPADNSIAFSSEQKLFLADIIGANRRLVADPGTEPVWSPDGKSLAYAAGGIHIYHPESGLDRLLIANVDNGSAEGFTVYRPVSWSPDGKKMLASIGFYEGEGLGVLSTTDGTILAEAPMENMTAWSNDSQTVFIASSGYREMGGLESGLWSLGEDGEPSALIRGDPVWWPHQRPDGELAIFLIGHPGEKTGSLYLILLLFTAEGSFVSELRSESLPLDLRDLFETRWSPDGDCLVARLYRPALGTGEVVLIPAGEGPSVYLMPEGENFQWGK